jgi:hypothetical protein
LFLLPAVAVPPDQVEHGGPAAAGRGGDEVVGAGQDGGRGGGDHAGDGGGVQQLEVVGAVADGQDPARVDALLGAVGQDPAPLADPRRPDLDGGAAVDQVGDDAGAAGRADRRRDRGEQVGRPTTANAYTGSVSTT